MERDNFTQRDGKVFKPGQRVRVWVDSTGELLAAEWTFRGYDAPNGLMWLVKDGQKHEQCGDTAHLRLEHLECQHDWQRVTMFRFDSFCCKHCPATRQFDKEKDEAA